MLGNLEYKPDSQATDCWNYYSGDNLMNKVEAVDDGSTVTIDMTWEPAQRDTPFVS